MAIYYKYIYFLKKRFIKQNTYLFLLYTLFYIDKYFTLHTRNMDMGKCSTFNFIQEKNALPSKMY